MFLLGSGSSINQISASRWNTIRRYDSIGFNFWLFHDLVPTIYLFEMTQDADVEVTKILADVANKSSERYRQTPKIVSEFRNGSTLFDRLGDEFRADLYAYLSVPAYVDSDRQLTISMKLLKRLGVFAPGSKAHNLFKHGGSLSVAISLAIKMGYRRIVLCGIDLNCPTYFYEDKALYPDVGTFQNSIYTAKHDSIVPGLFRCSYPIDKIVAELKKEILDPMGIEIYVENKSSALYPNIPLAPDTLWAELEGAEASQH